MKKLYLVLICLTLAAVLTACSGEPAAPDSGSTVSASSVADKPSGNAMITAEDITLTGDQMGQMNIELINAGGLDKYGNGKMAGFQFYIKYDPAVLTLIEAELALDNANGKNNWQLSYSDKGNGSARVMIMDDKLTGLAADSIPLVTLYMQAVSGATGPAKIDFELETVCDSTGNSEVAEYISGGSAAVTIE